MTKTSAIMGSPVYMSPEQMNSAKSVDGRTDIWALGVVLHELMTGRPPFYAESVMELAVKIANEPPPPLRTIRPDAAADLEAAVLRCLEKDPARRFKNVGELALALMPFGPRRSKASVECISGIIQCAHPIPSNARGIRGDQIGLVCRFVDSTSKEMTMAPEGPARYTARSFALGADFTINRMHKQGERSGDGCNPSSRNTLEKASDTARGKNASTRKVGLSS
jgi:serine/threonine protein kinase